MRASRVALTVIILTLFFIPQAKASDALSAQIQDLTAQMNQMRADYNSQISALRAEVQELRGNQKISTQGLQNGTPDQGGFHVDYVGRENGPFGKGGFVAEDVAGVATVSVGGYADIELENFQNRNSTFDQHHWVLNLGAEIGERLRFFSELEVEHGGPDSAGGGELSIEQAWFDFLIADAINLRAGALLVPFGRYNAYHDAPEQDLTDHPLVNRRVIPTTWTEAGAGFYGSFNPKIGNYEDLELNYEIYMVNGLDTGGSDTGLRGARGSLETDNNNNKGIVGRLVTSPAIGHELGLSGYFGDVNGYGDSLGGIGVDFLTTWGPLEILGEWAYFNAEETSQKNTLGGIDDIANHYQGAYLQANYHFWFDFLDDTFLGKTFDDPTFTLVNRFGFARIDDDFDGGSSFEKDNEEWRYTLGINYRPVESWVLKLEYQNNHSKVEALERGNDEGFIASIAMGF